MSPTDGQCLEYQIVKEPEVLMSIGSKAAASLCLFGIIGAILLPIVEVTLEPGVLCSFLIFAIVGISPTLFFLPSSATLALALAGFFCEVALLRVFGARMNGVTTGQATLAFHSPDFDPGWKKVLR